MFSLDDDVAFLLVSAKHTCFITSGENFCVFVPISQCPLLIVSIVIVWQYTDYRLSHKSFTSPGRQGLESIHMVFSGLI